MKEQERKNVCVTSESVTAGHPDKMCDCISDAILDACLEVDPNARVAVEVCVKSHPTEIDHLIIAGEVTMEGEIDYTTIARDTAEHIGYTDLRYGMDATCPTKLQVQVLVNQQSPDIAQGVDNEGAGDQGVMFGYASRESEAFPELRGSFMPVPILLAHKLTDAMTRSREDGNLPWARPDGKAQVTVSYHRGCEPYRHRPRPKRVETVVIAIQHDNLANERFGGDVAKEHAYITSEIENLVWNTIPLELQHDEMRIIVNGTGRFLTGGPVADAGLTGRKIVVDAYGGHAPHGGGAFSGKDPSKVDRSANYYARYVARRVCAEVGVNWCEISLAYAIGMEEPINIDVRIPDFPQRLQTDYLKAKVREFMEQFDFRPREIIAQLDLKQPIYRQTASGGHFGRRAFPWEN